MIRCKYSVFFNNCTLFSLYVKKKPQNILFTNKNRKFA